MTLEEFKTKYPDIATALVNEGDQTGFDRGFKEGEKAGIQKASHENQEQARADGAKDERDRIRAVQEQLIPGHEGLIQTLMFDGETSGPEAAVKVLAAEKKLRADVITDHLKDAPDVLPDPSTDKDVDTTAQDQNLPVEERAQKTWDSEPQTRKEFNNDYSAYLAWFKAQAGGQIKIYQGKVTK